MPQNEIQFRAATEADLVAIVDMLADDEIGRTRELPGEPLAKSYTMAFRAMHEDPKHILAVAVDIDTVVGTLQVSFIPGMARTGMWRGQIEAVRIAPAYRNGGLGREMFEWAIAQCRERGCGLVQLTTDKGRPDAHRFYESLGFEASHEGYKLRL